MLTKIKQIHTKYIKTYKDILLKFLLKRIPTCKRLLAAYVRKIAINAP